ncbi:MAG: zf-HC2 domain-containing protein [Gemmatimonadota bacterium]
MDSEAIAAYLDGVLSPGETASVEGHLADCPSCRSGVTEAARLLRSRHRRRRWFIAGPAVAAAAAAILIFSSSPTGVPEPADGVVRGGELAESEAVPRITPLAPRPGSVVGTDSIVFLWESVGGRVTYRVTLTLESGDVLWTEDTSDTTIALPSGIEMAPDRVYFWYVDALMADASSATTGVQEFRTAP